jgi:hypothetical protein
VLIGVLTRPLKRGCIRRQQCNEIGLRLGSERRLRARFGIEAGERNVFGARTGNVTRRRHIITSALVVEEVTRFVNRHG